MRTDDVHFPRRTSIKFTPRRNSRVFLAECRRRRRCVLARTLNITRVIVQMLATFPRKRHFTLRWTWKPLSVTIVVNIFVTRS